MKMTRREHLKTSAVLTAFGLSAGTTLSLLSSCSSDVKADPSGFKPSSLSIDQFNLVKNVVEKIIPRTDTPGANDAKVEEFIDYSIAQHLKPKEKQLVLNGLSKFDTEAQSTFNKNYLDLSDEDQINVLTTLSESTEKKNIFGLMRNLTIHAYFTSELGATEALAYDPIPGEYIPCMDVTEDTKTWAI